MKGRIVMAFVIIEMLNGSQVRSTCHALCSVQNLGGEVDARLRTKSYTALLPFESGIASLPTGCIGRSLELSQSVLCLQKHCHRTSWLGSDRSALIIVTLLSRSRGAV